MPAINDKSSGSSEYPIYGSLLRACRWASQASPAMCQLCNASYWRLLRRRDCENTTDTLQCHSSSNVMQTGRRSDLRSAGTVSVSWRLRTSCRRRPSWPSAPTSCLVASLRSDDPGLRSVPGRVGSLASRTITRLLHACVAGAAALPRSLKPRRAGRPRMPPISSSK